MLLNTLSPVPGSRPERKRLGRGIGSTLGKTSGKGHILSAATLMDSHLAYMAQDQPHNIALVTLDDEPRINFFANLTGIKPEDVPIGAAVEVTFEEVAPGRLVHDWKLIEG